MTNLVIVLVLTVLVIQLYVSIRLCINVDSTVSQKLWQLLIVWSVPLVGAILVWSFMVSNNGHSNVRDTAFTPDRRGPPDV